MPRLSAALSRMVDGSHASPPSSLHAHLGGLLHLDGGPLLRLLALLGLQEPWQDGVGGVEGALRGTNARVRARNSQRHKLTTHRLAHDVARAQVALDVELDALLADTDGACSKRARGSCGLVGSTVSQVGGEQPSSCRVRPSLAASEASAHCGDGPKEGLGRPHRATRRWRMRWAARSTVLSPTSNPPAGPASLQPHSQVSPSTAKSRTMRWNSPDGILTMHLYSARRRRGWDGSAWNGRKVRRKLYGRECRTATPRPHSRAYPLPHAAVHTHPSQGCPGAPSQCPSA